MAIKVLHMIDSGGLYGAEKMLLALVKRQINQGLAPMILSAGELNITEKPLEKEAKSLKLPVTAWRMKPRFNLTETYNIIKWIRENNFDLIHTHGFKFNFLMGILPRSLKKIPQIVTLHGFVHAPFPSNIWLYQTVDALTLFRSQKIVIVNNNMRELFFIKMLPKNKVVYIANGIENTAAKNFTIPNKIKEFTEKYTINLVAIGRLSPEKGFHLLIEALASEKEAFKTVGLCILGEGPLKASLQSLITTKHLEHQIILGGYIPNISDFLPIFDALIMPSLSEGLPITLLEAMKDKVPVIASAVGGIPHALDHGRCGILFEPNNIKSLGRILSESLNSPDQLALLAGQAQKRFLTLFTAEAMADQYLKVYSECL